MSDMTPETRKEHWMARAAGEDELALEPQTKEEHWWQKIIDAIESGGGGGGGAVSSVNGKTGAVVLTAADLDDSFKDALLDCFAHVAWTDEHGQDYYDTLEAAFYPPADLVSISAVYTQSGTVYDTDSLDDLKSDLVVTAHYADNTTKTVTTYTLSGTLTVGTSTITVSYGGKATTFTVTVTHQEGPGYVQDGLVFFLDGKDASASTWVDKIGNKMFALTDCSIGTNGVVFNGTSSKGICSGQITADWENETIELCVSNGNFTSSSGVMFFTQPFDTSVGISFRCGFDSAGTGRAALGLDGVTRGHKKFTTTGLKTFSATADAVVVNGTESTLNTHTTDYGKNLMGDTILGAGNTVDNDGYRLFFSGTIHAIRIYNRKLSVAEMQANQAVDLTYYGLLGG